LPAGDILFAGMARLTGNIPVAGPSGALCASKTASAVLSLRFISGKQDLSRQHIQRKSLILLA